MPITYSYLSSEKNLSTRGLTGPAREVLSSVADRESAEEAERILHELEWQLILVRKRSSTKDWPPIWAFEAEDRSLLIEWIFPHCRIGFSVESEPDESGWFLVSDDTTGRINASGRLVDVDTSQLITWLLSFITDFQQVME